MAATSLLQDVGQFVGQQFAAGCRIRIVFTLVEVDVAADRRGPGVQRLIKLLGRASGV
jgi:hypothetical protein